MAGYWETGLRKKVAMLRIKAEEKENRTGRWVHLIREGGLTGPWVEMLEKPWHPMAPSIVLLNGSDQRGSLDRSVPFFWTNWW